MIDLFDGSVGLNVRDSYIDGLENTVGLRVLHVASSINEDWFAYDNYGVSFEEYTIYQLVLVQAGKERTLLDNKTDNNSDSDYFKAGQSFSLAEYERFFYEGKMYNGATIPYVITVDSITVNPNGGHTATITITR